ncbi:hypothetical protein Poly41_54960 [Novipirellula artificiosorum]|uniref:Uncharacterized protein n=1 Tax=Novipirellula artificiosorum TaxID=2528016 RepID=A0A5C6D6R3_9BACT|nr:hypothetical protein Poly41_54960 [Novipirellula artificiosorum]
MEYGISLNVSPFTFRIVQEADSDGPTRFTLPDKDPLSPHDLGLPRFGFHRNVGIFKLTGKLTAIGCRSLVSTLARTKRIFEFGIVNQRTGRQLPPPTVHEIRVGLCSDHPAIP